jgi:ABC-type transport system substrate-binding protein
MPSVSEDGITYIFKLKKGVLFHDNKCFKDGIGREMTSADVVYSIKRLADPKLQSKGWWLLDGRVLGLNEWRSQYADAKKVDYDADIDGVTVIDKYTVQFKLTKPFPQFLYALAMPFTVIVPEEAVNTYGQEFLNNPVGTGPFTTSTYTQTNKIVYTKNPKYRPEYYPSEGEASDKENGLLQDAGKRLPLVDKIIVSVITEEQTRWLNFLKGNIDSVSIPPDQFTQIIVPGQGLAKDFVEKGIKTQKKVGIDITYNAFNNANKLFKDNLKLRQAMSLAYDKEKINKNFFYGVSRPAQSIVPPDVAGYDKSYRGPYQNFDLEKAKKLIAEAGYPAGKGLPEITYHYKYDTQGRKIAEMFKQMMAQIGVQIKLMGVTWPELVKLVNTKQTMMYSMAWGADYPDAENFLQLLYGPNEAPGSNGSNFSSPEFNKMYQTISLMPDSAERTALYKKMSVFSAENVPMIYGLHRVGFGLIHSWVRNMKPIEFNHGVGKYYNIDLEIKEKNIKKL